MGWVRSQLQELGRYGECYVLISGAEQCPAIVGSAVGSDPNFPGGGGAAELG